MLVREIFNRLVMRMFGRVNNIGPYLDQYGCACYTSTGYLLYCTCKMTQFGVYLQIIMFTQPSKSMRFCVWMQWGRKAGITWGFWL